VIAGGDADVIAGLSFMPEYITLLTEEQLGVLIERLSDPQNMHLLQVLALLYTAFPPAVDKPYPIFTSHDVSLHMMSHFA
jgi:hypothetical protein